VLLKHVINSHLTSTGFGRVKKATRWNDVSIFFLPQVLISLSFKNIKEVHETGINRV